MLAQACPGGADDLVMGYDTRSRDRSRWAVTGLSGALAAGVLVGTGAVTGEAARTHRAEEQAEQERRAEEYAAWQAEQAAYEAALAEQERASEPRVVVKQRPRRTRVTTRYITAAAPSGVSVGASGTTPRGAGSPSSSTPRSDGGGGGGGGGGGAPGPTPGPPPPPPPPPPASSGS